MQVGITSEIPMYPEWEPGKVISKNREKSVVVLIELLIGPCGENACEIRAQSTYCVCLTRSLMF